ncbi:SURF1 family cytochrome oxidase biogenesis protein, partial [Bordetella bronchiseptica]
MTLAALLLLGIAAAILASLGRWQLHRADERRAVLAAIEGGRGGVMGGIGGFTGTLPTLWCTLR